MVSANLPDGSAQSTPGCSVQSPSSPVDSPSHGGPTPGPAITRVVSQASLDARASNVAVNTRPELGDASSSYA
jgi:hypothetical protein